MDGYKRNRKKEFLHELIFEADTRSGKIFDIALLIMIFTSVVVVMLESVEEGIGGKYHDLFYALEWVFTIFFTIEYIFRVYCVYRPIRYVTSFFGIIDLLALLPTYISFFIAGSQSLMVIRALRLLRVFRIFKMLNFLNQSDLILNALKASRAKIAVFMFSIVLLVCIFGSLMYLIEGAANETFDSIPRSVYWAIVTLTTVGYGDISPITSFGQFVASCVMIMGYAIIAVPTGIVSAEIIRSDTKVQSTQACRFCAREGHDSNALFCKYCGERLNDDGEHTS